MTSQTCRACGRDFPHSPDADYCPSCAAENIGSPWQYLGDWDGFEYWRAPMSAGNYAGDVFRRRPCADNYIGPDGQPSALRWEGTFGHFSRFVAGRLHV